MDMDFLPHPPAPAENQARNNTSLLLGVWVADADADAGRNTTEQKKISLVRQAKPCMILLPRIHSSPPPPLMTPDYICISTANGHWHHSPPPPPPPSPQAFFKLIVVEEIEKVPAGSHGQGHQPHLRGVHPRRRVEPLRRRQLRQDHRPRVQAGGDPGAGGQPRPPADARRAAGGGRPVEPLPEGPAAPLRLQRRRHPRQVRERGPHHHAPQEAPFAPGRAGAHAGAGDAQARAQEALRGAVPEAARGAPRAREAVGPRRPFPEALRRPQALAAPEAGRHSRACKAGAPRTSTGAGIGVPEEARAARVPEADGGVGEGGGQEQEAARGGGHGQDAAGGGRGGGEAEDGEGGEGQDGGGQEDGGGEEDGRGDGEDDGHGAAEEARARQPRAAGERGRGGARARRDHRVRVAQPQRRCLRRRRGRRSRELRRRDVNCDRSGGMHAAAGAEHLRRETRRLDESSYVCAGGGEYMEALE